MAALVLTLAMTLLSSVSINPGQTAKPPDCLYVAYGCEYYIWDMGGGRGEALVTCDNGGTFSAYSGSMGYCPNQ